MESSLHKSRIVVVAVLVLLLSSFCIMASRPARESEARRKARYYYTAGAVAKAEGKEDCAFEFFKKAWMADPSYPEAAGEYGSARLALPIDTLQSDEELNRSLSMMRQYVDYYPEDIHEAQYYGYVTTRLGEWDEAIRVLGRTAEEKRYASMAYLQLSEAYAGKGDLKKAVDALDRFERSDGVNPQVTMRKLSYLLADKDTVGAVNEVSRLLNSDPSNVDYAIMKGNVFDIIQRPDSALRYYQLAEQIDPESGNAKLAVAGYYRQSGDSLAYDNKMYEVLLTEDLDLDTKLEFLAQYLQSLINDKHDTERGDYLFSVVRGQYPHEPRILDFAARYSAAKGNYTEAEEEISYALDLDPTNVTYWGQLMTYQAAADHPDKALETYLRAEKHIVPDDNLRLYHSIVAQQAGRYDIAARVYRDLIDSVQPGLQLDSLVSLSMVRRNITADELDRLSNLVASLGDIYHESGDSLRSYRMYENALVFNPSNAMAANNYAYFLCTDGGDLDKALELSEKSLSGKDDDNPTYLDTYAWIQYLKGNYAIAEEYQQKAIEAQEKEPYQSAELYVHFGDIKEKLGKVAEALEYWRKAAGIFEENEATDEDEYKQLKQKMDRAEASLPEATKDSRQ